jgi:hypothetical protein
MGAYGWYSSCGRSFLQGNESRLTAYRLEDLEQVGRVPSGAFSAPFDGSFVCDLAYQIEGEVADHGHVFGAVTGSQTRQILMEGDVEVQ